MTYEYKAFKPELPPREHRITRSPIMNNQDMEWWLNKMSGDGWKLITAGTTHWISDVPTQDWWIFRKSANNESFEKLKKLAHEAILSLDQETNASLIEDIKKILGD